MRKRNLFVALVALSLFLIGTAAVPPDTEAGDYIGRICWQFTGYGNTEGPILVADITYMGGEGLYPFTYIGLLILPEGEGTRTAAVMGPMILSGSGLGFEGYVNVWNFPDSDDTSGPAEGAVSYFKARVSATTLEGYFNNVTIGFDSGGMDHEADAGTVALFPCELL